MRTLHNHFSSDFEIIEIRYGDEDKKKKKVLQAHDFDFDY